MIKQYKGYELRVIWDSIEKGYIFCVVSKDGEEIKANAPYFYEENALAGAKETIDKLQIKRE